MKTFITVVVVLILASSLSSAGTPTPIVDTIRASTATGAPDRFVAYWQLTASTTPDTLIAPGMFANFKVISGAGATDTLFISTAQDGWVPKYADKTIGVAASLERQFNATVLRKLVIKGSGSFAAKVWAWN